MAPKWFYFGAVTVVSGSILWLYYRRNNTPSKRHSKVKEESNLRTSEESSESVKVPVSVILSLEAAKVLSSVITDHANPQLQEKAIATIVQQTAIFHNHDILREAGCLKALSEYVKSVASDSNEHLDQSKNCHLIEMVLIAINNLASTESNLSDLQDCIRPLLYLASQDNNCYPETVRVGALKALINFTSIDRCLDYFTEEDIQLLFDMACSQLSHELRLQNLRLLANLSCNACAIPRLLGATLSESFLSDAQLNYTDDILLRWLTIFRNVTANRSVIEQGIVSCKSVNGKLTLYGYLNDNSHRQLLQTQLIQLSTHLDADIRSLSLQLLLNLFDTIDMEQHQENR